MDSTYFFCFEDSELECEMDYEPRDPECGIYTATASLISAKLAGVDIITLLSKEVIRTIECDAAESFIDTERDERESDY